MAFLAELLGAVQQRYRVDASRVYATGFSAGGMAAYWLGIQMAPVFAAIAPNAGATLLGFDFPPSEPVAVLDTSGLHDRTVPMDVRTSKTQVAGPHNSAVSKDGFFFTPTRNVTRQFAEVAGCSFGAAIEFPTEVDGVDQWSCSQVWGACEGGVQIVECTGYWGHVSDVLPDAPAQYQQPGGYSSAFAEVVWSFFKVHRKQNRTAASSRGAHRLHA